LGKRDALSEAIEQARISEESGADARVAIRLRTGQVGIQDGEVRCAGFHHLFVANLNFILSCEDLGMVFERQIHGILK
jgi:hypothetical protein